MYLFLKSCALDPVQQERQYDRNRKSPQQAVNAQLQGVGQIAHEVRRGQESGKMLESHPFASGNTPEWVVVLERDQNAAHGRVLEDQRQQKRRHQEDRIQLPVLLHIQHGVVESLVLSLIWNSCCICIHNFLLSVKSHFLLHTFSLITLFFSFLIF